MTMEIKRRLTHEDVRATWCHTAGSNADVPVQILFCDRTGDCRAADITVADIDTLIEVLKEVKNNIKSKEK